MFEDDICKCGNPDKCPKKGECLRATPHGPGIYTMSMFYTENKECEYFLKRKGADKNAE